jgi:3-methyladenine DNA glycosylase AlkC
MGYYDLSKHEREKLVNKMKENVIQDISNSGTDNILKYASDSDTYIRKNVYLIIGRNYRDSKKYREPILEILQKLFKHENELIRQTIVNAAGEIGKHDADKITDLLKGAMNDEHYKVRNAVIGTLKKMSKKNPKPTLQFAEQFLDNPDPKIRRQVIHGVELRGRTHPEDVLPILRKVQDETYKKVRDTIIHVLAQISYKEGCLQKVLNELKSWHNRALVREALEEIKKVHKNYDFSEHTPKQVEKIINNQF